MHVADAVAMCDLHEAGLLVSSDGRLTEGGRLGVFCECHFVQREEREELGRVPVRDAEAGGGRGGRRMTPLPICGHVSSVP